MSTPLRAKFKAMGNYADRLAQEEAKVNLQTAEQLGFLKNRWEEYAATVVQPAIAEVHQCLSDGKFANISITPVQPSADGLTVMIGATYPPTGKTTKVQVSCSNFLSQGMPAMRMATHVYKLPGTSQGMGGSYSAEQLSTMILGFFVVNV